ncbi:MAG TPA: site-2 protease family protein [Polyangiaceae bacterium]|jgi:Zn-dependent protease|nr:site-2 protease family protein [Polyangiaceae bacterium]
MGVLRFRLFGFPVAILPGYWLLSALMGFGVGQRSVQSGLLLMAVMFCSILVHELGHALMARAFGLPAQITLHMMGGATGFPSAPKLTRGRDILVSLAGPGAGLLLACVAWIASKWIAPDAWSDTGAESLAPLATLMVSLVWINLVWSVLNLMPVMPFDGGRVLAAALGPTRQVAAGGISLTVGLLLAVWLFKVGSVFPAVLFATAALSSFMRMRQSNSAPPRVDDHILARVLEAAEAALKAEQFQQASALAHRVLTNTTAADLGRRALATLLWARLGAGDAAGARALLLSAPERAVDRYLAAAVYEATDELDSAKRLLSEARSQGDARVQVTALLVKILLRQGKFAPAANLTREILDGIAPSEVRRVAMEARDGGASAEAARLSLALAKLQRSSADAIDAIFGFALAGLQDEAKTAFSLAYDYDPELARRLLDDARLSQIRQELAALC